MLLRRANGEDELGSVIGLLVMISVIAGTVPPAAPLNDPAITRPGGWILMGV